MTAYNQRATVWGKRILFWKDLDDPIAKFTEFVDKVFRIAPLPDPHDCVRRDIPYDDRQVVIKALDFRSTMNPTGGEVLMGYMGRARCRICNIELGSRDLHGYGFVWPEKADHYIAVHQVWTADCDDLLAAVRRGR